MSDEIGGSCLCGAVRYRIRPPFSWFQYCYCSRCRKVSGSAHSSHLLLAIEQLSWTAGEEQLGRYELPGAKAFTTCFCRTCGSTLPWTTQNGRWVLVPAGTLDDDPGERPQRNIHWASRAPWYRVCSDLPAFESIPPGK